MPLGYLLLVLHAHLPFVRHPEYDEISGGRRRDDGSNSSGGLVDDVIWPDDPNDVAALDNDARGNRNIFGTPCHRAHIDAPGPVLLRGIGEALTSEVFVHDENVE